MIIRWRDLLVAVFFAVLFWYGVTGSEKIESQIEMRVDYRGMPADMVVLEGLVNRASVRISAPAGMLRSMYARQDYMVSVDLSNLAKGENILPITIPPYLLGRGVEIIDINPPRLTLMVDRHETNLVPLKVNVQNDLIKDYTIKTSVLPEHVLLKGAQSIIEETAELSVQVALSGDLPPGRQTFKKVIPLPQGLDATPTMVEVHVDLSLKRESVTLMVPLAVLNAGNTPVTTSPSQVKIEALVPASQATAAKMKGRVAATVMAPVLRTLEEIVPVAVTLPENCQLVSVTPSEIAVSIEAQETDIPPVK